MHSRSKDDRVEEAASTPEALGSQFFLGACVKHGCGSGAISYLQQIQARLIYGGAVLGELHGGPDGEGRIPVLEGRHAGPRLFGRGA